MAINQLSSSNTFQHWLIATQKLITVANNLTDGGSGETFFVNTNLTVLGTINASNGIVTTNILANTGTINTVTINVASINVANIRTINANIARVNVIVFNDNTILTSNVGLFTGPLAQAAYNKANSANVLAQAAFDKANVVNIHAQAAYDKANSTDSRIVNAAINLTTTSLYPVMVGVDGQDVVANVTPTKFAFNASTGKLSLNGLYSSSGSSGGFEVTTRNGTPKAYTVYAETTGGQSIFKVKNEDTSSDLLFLTENGFLGVGSNKSGPTAKLDWDESVTVLSGFVPVYALPSRTLVATSSITIILPANPSEGNWIKIRTIGNDANPTITRNTKKIMGLEEDLSIDESNVSFTLTYTGSTIGWVLN